MLLKTLFIKIVIFILVSNLPITFCEICKEQSAQACQIRTIHSASALWKFGLIEDEYLCHINHHIRAKKFNKEKNIEHSNNKMGLLSPSNIINAQDQHDGRKILLIRHAQSQYNSAIAQVRKLLEGREEVEALKEIARTKFNEELIDAPITEEGEKQVINYQEAEEAAKVLKDKKIGLVITSPLRRCLQTTKKLFENHKNKPKVLVYPLLKEITSSSCDIPSDLNKIQKEFPNYDFSLLEEYPIKELWFVEILANEEQKKAFLEELNVNYPNKEDAIQNAPKLMVSKMLDNFPREFELQIDLNRRVIKAKTWLREKLKEVKEDELMAIVTHSKVLQSFISKEYGELGEFIGSRRLVNCEIMEYLL